MFDSDTVLNTANPCKATNEHWSKSTWFVVRGFLNRQIFTFVKILIGHIFPPILHPPLSMSKVNKYVQVAHVDTS